ncbi:MAG: nitrous oxide-stimulated promoter family protein [Eubacteriales bacterium]|nr:nitrous oxide-stimulated promoter family protein [Eubacteriales bacterium]
MNELERKRRKEQQVVAEMIALYCRKKHVRRKGQPLCPDCRALLEYAQTRSAHCPFMEQKTFCSNCRVHCYKPDMRENIRRVMRFSGPRMLLYHPLLAIWHVVCSKKEKRKQE